MKKTAILGTVLLAILVLVGCTTSPVATCDAGDTACLEAALAASAAPATDVSAQDQNTRDGGDWNPPARPEPTCSTC
jgi:PBP1b-binding outer membrane lipoprotein LpoB